MYVDSSTATKHRSSDTRRLRSACPPATRQIATATPSAQTSRRRPATAAARRTRLADAIVSQWLLEQLPADQRHVSAPA
jgi:hypothetical protein